MARATTHGGDPGVDAPSGGYPAAHIPAVDGLRGVAILLVALSHGWLLWPTDHLDDHRLLFAPFTSGNVAVSVFFAITAFMATRASLDDLSAGRRRAVPRRIAHRWVRIHTQVFALLAAVLVWSLVVVPDDYQDYDTGTSVLRIATSSWNWFLISDPMIARSDLGHLWYLSVDMQLLIVLGLVVWIAHRHRVLLATGLAAGGTLAGIWRAHEFDAQSPYQALLMTTTRMDSFLWGAAAGALWVWARPHASRFRWPGTVALIAMVPVAVWASDVRTYAGWGGLVVDVLVVVVLLSVTTNEDLPLVGGLLRARPLRVVGAISLGLYVWHYPVFWAVAVQTPDWAWPARTVVAVGLTVAAAELTRRRLEQPLTHWLRRGSE
ncbi:Peptidoglycan/LPS O-acetylase OafA/YrhL, contains acyltransferase and SGNH-hydrolase domains [Nocardioides exalbidus]|uniref:Peptidoglycan/LPS O-acetylase OafA/YrhL, contains acyltransferase and SGNH-hydrolase domains n=1 Tax=Nocardioides exalbidus TaxID=402596 RepID=A0A1H4X9Y2_9ACTN|nr:acyltransferase [Nocardioides exalbidus]SED02393.1 Peptidoglycan/LPS O-acetylase OafA/YrhL, contains acyltransferase and SGNH-hydrolase domains [Nocardioides exalbidus]